MRRATRKGLTNLTIFVTAILTIVYLTRHTDHSTIYAWSQVRYTSPSSPPPAHGVCPGLDPSGNPALVVARTSGEDASWLEQLRSKYQLCIYTVDEPSGGSAELQVPANRAHEAMPYLTFLVDNYGSLPAAGAVFLHGSRLAWHNDDPDYDNLPLLQALDVDAATAKHGFHNLRCDWSASTCPRDTVPQGGYETRSRALLEPYNQRVLSDSKIPAAFSAIFGGESGPGFSGGEELHVRLGRKEALRAQCCAQFVVSRESMWQHPREEYAALRQWLLDGLDPVLGKWAGAAPRDDKIAGRIVSYLWHVLFVRHSSVTAEDGSGLDIEKLNEAGCPTAQECYCTLYGRCGLKNCKEGRCRGQYQVPADYKVTVPDRDGL